MKGVSHLKGVSDIRTAISAHYRSTSRQKGTPYLEIMSFGMELLRLQEEAARLDKRRRRVGRRLSEIQGLISKAIDEVGHACAPGDESRTCGPAAGPDDVRWQKMKVEY